MIGSVINEGVRGIQSAQRDASIAANETARAGISPTADNRQGVGGQTDSLGSTLAPVAESAQTERGGSFAEPLVELRRQELLFNASAQVISTGNENIGTLLDTIA